MRLGLGILGVGGRYGAFRLNAPSQSGHFLEAEAFVSFHSGNLIGARIANRLVQDVCLHPSGRRALVLSSIRSILQSSAERIHAPSCQVWPRVRMEESGWGYSLL